MLGPWGPVDHTLRAADLHDDLEREVTTCVGETVSKTLLLEVDASG